MGMGGSCPVPGHLRNPCPSTATSWSWKCHFFPYTVTAERSSTADGWRWRLALSAQPPFIVGTWKGSCWEEYSAVANRASRAKNRYLQNPLHSEPSSVCCPATASACLHGCSRDMKLFVNFSHMESMIQNVKLKIWLQTPENVNLAKFGCHITHKRRPKSTTCY